MLKLELGLPVTLEEDKEEGLVVALAVAEIPAVPAAPTAVAVNVVIVAALASAPFGP